MYIYYIVLCGVDYLFIFLRIIIHVMRVPI